MLAVVALVGVVHAADEADGAPRPFLHRLAAALGLDPGQVEDAVREAALGALDDAVADGRIPEDRADAIRERIEQGNFRLHPDFGRPGRAPRGPWAARALPVGPALEPVLDLLGLTPDELHDELRQGKTLAQVAEDRGISRDEVGDATLEVAQKRLDEGVAEGRLTQEQADRRLQALEEHIDALLDRSLPEGKRMKGPKFPSRGPAPEADDTDL